MSMSGPPIVPRRGHHHQPSLPDGTFSPTSSTNSSITSPPPEPPSSSSFVSNYSQSNNFGSCLQSSYEAISKRHEEELRALESLRGHIFKRQRADKEYADQLGRINLSCERAAQFPSSTTSSIVQVCVLLCRGVVSLLVCKLLCKNKVKCVFGVVSPRGYTP